MKNYYMAITDYSEIRFLTNDYGAKENPEEMLKESGFLSEKGNPAPSAVAALQEKLMPGLMDRLASKLQNRVNGIEPVIDTYLKMYSDKDFAGMYLYTVFLYGFVGWRTPLELNLLSSRRELLKIYFTGLVGTLEAMRAERSEDDEREETE